MPILSGPDQSMQKYIVTSSYEIINLLLFLKIGDELLEKHKIWFQYV